jgi:hypothetical protein
VASADCFAEIVPDRHSCEDLLCAVIALAIKDLEEIDHLQSKPALTAHESQKLHALTREWPPAAFLGGDWFEEICRMLNAVPETIRAAVRKRRESDDGWSRRDERRLNPLSHGVALGSLNTEEETSR